MPQVRIVGGGVSGVTTGIALRLLGYDVTIVAERLMDEPDLDDPELGDPTFASMFPAASIIPNVAVEHGGWQADTALRFFGALQSVSGAGVRRQRHYDVCEAPTPTPAFARALDDFEEFTTGTDDPRVPRRTGCDRVWGWSFDCLFAEMPAYRRWLLDLYSVLGGTFDPCRRVTRQDLARYPEPVIVNCTGYGSGALFDTAPELTLVKGILVKVAPPPSGLCSGMPPVSYSYTPDRSVYARPSGVAANVYFYPRADCWLLGGTRLPGTIDDVGRWAGASAPGPTIAINGVQVPSAIVELNRDLIRSLTGVDIDGFERRAVFGYRCQRRASLGGLCLRPERMGDKLVVHNYAHGGAGVTLSWGSALRVARMIATAGASVPRPPRPVGDRGPTATLAELVVRALPGTPG